MTWRDAVLAAFLGTSCVGCDRPGRPWCPQCAAQMAALVDPVVSSGQPPVIACAPYSAVMPAAIVGFKDRGVASLRGELAAVLAAGLLMALDEVGPALVVPAPSAPAAVRRRGTDHMHVLAREAAGLADLPCRRLLRTTGRADQAGLGFRARRRNVRDTMSVRRSGRGPVIVVDDVRTSGATLAECEAALRRGGYTPLAHVVIAAGIADPACGGGRERVSVNCSTGVAQKEGCRE